MANDECIAFQLSRITCVSGHLALESSFSLMTAFIIRLRIALSSHCQWHCTWVHPLDALQYILKTKYNAFMTAYFGLKYPSPTDIV